MSNQSEVCPPAYVQQPSFWQSIHIAPAHHFGTKFSRKSLPVCLRVQQKYVQQNIAGVRINTNHDCIPWSSLKAHDPLISILAHALSREKRRKSAHTKIMLMLAFFMLPAPLAKII
jgi:hypothetical protein